ncbi:MULTISPECIES: hypothetical protein [unclassified Colwellia]|uniref:hypothetical protein n=1 Tax=unclassified Colwellia TaxID=196834 RepID=UPI0015F6DEFB|nr:MULTISPECIES: hypothetical protein [unclassified Colwellia]MBA6355404.1 hypothetical protein [Colwellia sp. BRX8-3]MBA6358750.1 hypothetical protein [Colwellia sp. BRX8-6]MBA6367275.1 hypothetical protein [Colwellia sp. BRX8-5]MBA6373696.1 hypothetical protein [Colwellia sp. BRX8-2]
MKTLLITTLTTALLSFNSFADNTTDIKTIANLMVKTGIEQLNTKLTSSVKDKVQPDITMSALANNKYSQILVAKLSNKKGTQQKNTVQVADE